MKVCLYFLVMLQFGTGCILKDEKQTKRISGYTGGSVLLPCSCAQPQSTVNTFSWEFYHSDNKWIQVFEDKNYSRRLVLFNESSPINMSLLISGLREDDAGFYTCMSEASHVDIILKVLEKPRQKYKVPRRPVSPLYTNQRCDLVRNRQTFDVTGYSGESVVLPCSCTELLAKPEQIQWMYSTGNYSEEIYPNEPTESHKNRVKLLNQSSPGNLSLLISALTTKDQGYYYCSAWSQQYVYIRLYVKEKPHIHLTSLSTNETSCQTQELEPPQQAHHSPQYGFILVAVFTSVLLLAFLALSTRCAKDEMENTAIKTGPKPAHAQNHSVELIEYVNTSTERT